MSLLALSNVLILSLNLESFNLRSLPFCFIDFPACSSHFILQHADSIAQELAILSDLIPKGAGLCKADLGSLNIDDFH